MHSINLILAFTLLFVQTDVPFKAKDEFEIKVDYQIKKRPPVALHAFNATPGGTQDAMASYVILNIKILKKEADESRIIVNSNLQKKIFNRKIEEGTTMKLDLGFTEDIKSRLTAHEYVIHFQNSEKIPTHKILIEIDQDGFFNVNGEKRGKF